MNYNNHRPGLKARAAHLALALSSAAAVLTLGVSAVTAMPASAAGMASDVAQALKLRLPKTPIDAISCDTLGPWCEVVSGDTLFYIDETARYLFVGRLYDMEERRDVTAARLLELNPDLLAAGAARVASDAPAGRDEAPVQAASSHVDLSSLPAAGAIHWGNPKGERLVVFSDFQCGYCLRLTAELAKAKVMIEERPISIFGAGFNPRFDPLDGRHIVYGSYNGQVPYLYVGDILDGSYTLLNTPETFRGTGDWGVNGKIVYVSGDGLGDLWTIDPDGTNASLLYGSPSSEGGPRWSPTADRVVFGSHRFGNFDLYVYTLPPE